jgi:tetratricopeptide (TPR) repeat protein
MSKYNTDLDYVILDIDISREELKEIMAEADKIISENKESKENLAVAYLKKAQCIRKLYSGKTPETIFYDQMGMFSEERKYIKEFLFKALKLLPDMPEALMQLGLLNAHFPFGGKKFREKAIKFFSMAIQLKPNYAAAFNNRAMNFYDLFYEHQFLIKNKKYIEKSKNNFRIAVTDLTEAIRIRPFDAVYYVNRGIFYSNLEEYKEAVEDFSNAIHYASDALKDGLLKEGILIFTLRGKAYTELKDYNKAINDFSESFHLKQDHDKTLLLRGKAYFLAGEKEKAKADITEYLSRKRKTADDASRNEIIRIIGVTPKEYILSEKEKQEIENIAKWALGIND